MLRPSPYFKGSASFSTIGKIMRDFDSSFSIDDTSLNVKERMWNSRLKMEGFTQFRVKFSLFSSNLSNDEFRFFGFFQECDTERRVGIQ